MLKNMYGFHLLHGDLIVYGTTIDMCTPYLAELISVEDICIYSKYHNFRVYYKPAAKIQCFIEFLRVYKLARKYSVYGNFYEVADYVLNRQD